MIWVQTHKKSVNRTSTHQNIYFPIIHSYWQCFYPALVLSLRRARSKWFTVPKSALIGFFDNFLIFLHILTYFVTQHIYEGASKKKIIITGFFLFLAHRFSAEGKSRQTVLLPLEYRHKSRQRRKFEVIRVLDRDFRDHQSWEDRDFPNR